MWIDAKRTVPIGRYVIVTDCIFVGIGRFEMEADTPHWIYSFEGQSEQDSNNVTHWMEKPELPIRVLERVVKP